MLDFTLCQEGCPLKSNCKRYLTYEKLSEQKEIMYMVSIFKGTPYNKNTQSCDYLIPTNNEEIRRLSERASNSNKKDV